MKTIKNNWLLILIRIIWYVSTATALFFFVNNSFGFWLGSLIGGVGAFLIVIVEMFITSLIKKQTIQEVLITRILIFDYFASEENESAFEELRKQLEQKNNIKGTLKPGSNSNKD